MFDEMNLLRQNQPLQLLLGHYLSAEQAAPEAWQERLMLLADIAADELTKLHGYLLAHGWLAINTQAMAGGYRITPAGSRALRRAQAPETDEDEAPILELEPAWKGRRRKTKEAA
jgi:predicted transcriptional regulator